MVIRQRFVRFWLPLGLVAALVVFSIVAPWHWRRVHLRQLYDAAIERMDKAELDTAVAILEELIEKDPGYEDAEYRLAVAKYRLGHYGSAVNDLHRYIGRNSHRFFPPHRALALAHFTRARCYAMLARLPRSSESVSGDYDQRAIDDFSRVVGFLGRIESGDQELKDLSQACYLERGQAYYHRGQQSAEQARWQQAKNDLKNAIGSLEQLSAEDVPPPLKAKIALSLVSACYRSGEYQNAIDWYEYAQRSDTTRFESLLTWDAWDTYGAAFTELGREFTFKVPDLLRKTPRPGAKGVKEEDEGEKDEGEGDEMRKAERTRRFHQGLQHLANAAASKGPKQWQDELLHAIDQFTIVLSENPKHAEAYCNRGRAFLALRQLAQAIDDLKEAVALRRGYFDAYLLLGEAYYGQEEYYLSVVFFGKAALIKPDSFEAHLGRAKACVHDLRCGEVLRERDAARRLAPDRESEIDRELLKLLRENGDTLYGNDRWDLAVEMTSTALSIAPGDVDCRLMRARCRRKMKEFRASLADYEEVLRSGRYSADKLQIEIAGVHHDRGLQYKLNGWLKEAVHDFEIALQHNRDLQRELVPAITDLCQVIASSAVDRQDYREAVAYLRKAIKHDAGVEKEIAPFLSVIFLECGRIMERRLESEKARGYLEMAAEEDPENADARWELAEILDKLGEPIKAEQHRLEARDLSSKYRDRLSVPRLVE